METRPFKDGRNLWCGCGTAGETGRPCWDSYWPALLTSQEDTDWSQMIGQVKNLEEAAPLLPLLEEVGILFLDLPEEERQVWDLELDLALCSGEEACRQVLEFFGEETKP